MIRYDHIKRSIQQTFYTSLHITRGARRRVHLPVGIQAGNILVREPDGADIPRPLPRCQSLLPGGSSVRTALCSHGIHGNVRRWLLSAVCPVRHGLLPTRWVFLSGRASERTCLQSRKPFDQRVILTMCNDRHAQRFCLVHGIFHHLCVLHTNAVIRKPDRTSLQGLKIRQFAAQLVFVMVA